MSRIRQPLYDGSLLAMFKVTTIAVSGLVGAIMLAVCPSAFANAENIVPRFTLMFFFYAVLSFVFRLGWLVPCIVAGYLVGLLWEPPEVRSSPDRHVIFLINEIRILCISSFVGSVVGVILDAIQPVVDHLIPMSRMTHHG